jgi:hypothetical chaperone protein
MSVYLGFDFGTSNTVTTLIDEQDPYHPKYLHSDPSLIFLPDSGCHQQERYIGKEALTHYTNSGMNGRFIQSIKSILPDESFHSTRIYGKQYSAVDLTAMILRFFKTRIEEQTGRKIQKAVFGRPVRFSEFPHRDKLAQDRLAKAAYQSGFKEIDFQFEPIAAAYRYEHSLSNPETVLVGDFGGGTSDFTIMNLDPSRKTQEDRSKDILATYGVHIGGENFDSQIMWNRLVSYFGYGSNYESWGKMLPVPVHIFRTICQWERIPFLKSMKFREELKYFHNGSTNKAAIRRLTQLIEDNIGYAIFQKIEKAKHELSEHTASAIIYKRGDIDINHEIRDDEFDDYIKPELSGIDEALSVTLRLAGKSENEISTIFLTGGSSLVKGVKNIVKKRFTGSRFVIDNERFASVSHGLALTALRRNLKN